ncbi:MAG: hypothetical protein VB957_11385 [Pseudomonadales bacterium]
MLEKLQSLFHGRPIWMNSLMIFCAYMTFIYMPFDMFYKAVEDDKEIWLGFTLTGWMAKATEPLHWIIYGAGLHGFLKMKSWMWPWASVYVLQVGIGMMVWWVMHLSDTGHWAGSLFGIPFILLAVALYRAKDQFVDTVDSQMNADSQMSADEEDSG